MFEFKSKEDISLSIIKNIFGTLTEIINGVAGSDPLIELITVFNGAAVLIGGLFLAYTLFLGIVGTAQDGQVLGKSLNGPFVALRYSIFIPLILPVFKGYSIIQLIVIWFVLQGSALGSIAAQSMEKNILEAGNYTISTAFEEEIKNFAINTYKASACVYARKKDYDKSFFKSKGRKFEIKHDSNKNQVLYGVNSTDTGFQATCGKVQLPLYYKLSKVTEVAKTTNPGFLGDIAPKYKQLDFKNLADIHQKNVMNIIEISRASAEHYFKATKDKKEVNDLSVAFNKSIENAIISYKNQLASEAKRLSNSGSESFNDVKKFGWMILGTQHTNTMDMMNSINTSINVFPSTLFVKESVDKIRWVTSDFESYLFHSHKVLYEITQNPKYSFEYHEVEKDNRDSDQPEEQDRSLVNKMTNAISKYVTTLDFNNLQNDARNPIVIAMEMGHKIKDVAITSNLSISVLAGIGGLLSLGALTAVAVSLMPILLGIFGALYVVSFLLSFFIPNMFYIVFLGVIIGYMILVVESVLAATLWGVVHLSPKGDEMTGKGTQGYSLLISLFFRPILIVAGYAVSMIFIGIVGEFLNKTFASQFISSQSGTLGSGFSEVFGTIASLIIYTTIFLIICFTALSILYKVADQLMRWIGGGTGGLGDFASGFDTQAKMGAIASASQLKGLDKMSVSTVEGANKAGSALRNVSQKLFDAEKPFMGPEPISPTEGGGSGSMGEGVDNPSKDSDNKTIEAERNKWVDKTNDVN